MSNTIADATSYAEYLALGGEANRNVGGAMGKNEFLQLLSAQLRYQDPLEPASDTEFVSQLAQFSSLEQLENLGTAMTAMSTYQAYNMVGKFVVAEAYVDGELTPIPGVVDCIFTKSGVTYAQIGEYQVPIGSITEVYDNELLSGNNTLLETSNNLIGRTVKASIFETVTSTDEEGNEVEEEKEKIVQGVVSRVAIEDGVMYAYIDDGSGDDKRVAVGSIYDIGKTDEKSNTDEINALLALMNGNKPAEPDPTVPDTTVPESTEPDATVPESTEPDATVPESTEPDATVPESTEPDATVPESTEPGSTVPDPTEPDPTEL